MTTNRADERWKFLLRRLALGRVVAFLSQERDRQQCLTAVSTSGTRDRIRRFGTEAAFVSVLLSCSFSLWGAEEQLYYFVDEHGVKHYSNMRLEPRYQPLPPWLHLSWSTSVTLPAEEEKLTSSPDMEYVEDDVDANLEQHESK